MRVKRTGILLGLLVLTARVPALAADERVELQPRSGVTQPFLVTRPLGPPVASVILFTGGSGILGETMLNFLIRSRSKFAAAGFLVASPDVPSDHQRGLNALMRSSYEHARDIAVVIAWLRKSASVPVWLIGTSTGTISAANVAARLKAGGADGLVMTSVFVPSTSPPPAIYATVDVSAITIPTLFVHNKDDACPTSQFANVAPLMARFTQVIKKELVVVSGGSAPTSDICDSFHRHGFVGIEEEVIGDIARWIKGDRK